MKRGVVLKTIISGVTLLLFVLLFIGTVFAVSPINTHDRGVTIKGYDTVAYFTKGKPVTGKDEFSFKWKGAEWLFLSKEHMELFVKNPQKYAPQYGGYCAWAASRGYTADIDPEAWTIVDDKLYLNYNKKIRDKWSKDIPGNIRKADKNWPGILNK